MLDTNAQAVATLIAALPTLPAKDQPFAASLISKAPKGLSEKQMFWVRKLAEPKAPPVEVATVDLSPIAAFLGASQNKRPHVTLQAANGMRFRLQVGGPSSSQPGSINVTTTGSFASRTWYGRVTTAGKFEPTARLSDPVTAAAIVATLEAFAADPQAQASAYGLLTGDCCFCEAELTDPMSKAVGYGPICAKKHGLPHGR